MVSDTRDILEGRGRKGAAFYSVAVSGAILLGVVLFTFFPVGESSIYPPCVWKLATKSYCLGCGSTRGLYALFKGDIIGAFRYNMFMVITLPFFCYSYLTVLAKALFNVELPSIRFSPLFLKGIVFLLLLYWILRNVIPSFAPLK